MSKKIKLPNEDIAGRLGVGLREKKSSHPRVYGDFPLFYFSNLLKRDFPSEKVKGVIFGNFGAQNYGDDSILVGQLKELSKLKRCQVQVISRFPNKAVMPGAKQTGLLNFAGVIRAIYSADFLIIGGGGLFCKNDRGLVGIIFQMYLLILFFALPLLIRKKIYVLGIGFYKNVNPFISLLACILLKKTDIVTVRDTYSYKYLSEKHVPVQLYKDHSYFMELFPVDRVLREPFVKTNYDKKRFHVGIAIKKPRTQDEIKTLLSELKKFISANVADTNFWIFALDSHHGDSDREFAKDIRSSLTNNQRTRVFILPEYPDPARLFSMFKLMDYFIAMRFHGLLFAYRCDIPMYGLTYDQKCTSFLESIEKPVVNISDVSFQEMQRNFESIKKKQKATI